MEQQGQPKPGGLLGRFKLSWRTTPRTALRVAPWLVFGPITGFLCERAVGCFQRKEWVLGWLYIVLNAGILLDIPLLTARLAARL